MNNRSGGRASKRSGALTAAVGLCLVTAVGCGGDEGPTVIERDGVRLLVGAKTSASTSMRIVGRIALTEGNCVGLQIGEQKTVVVWPNGTTLTDNGRVDLPGLGTVEVGTSITGAGGISSPPYEGATMPTIPTECLGQEKKVITLQEENLTRS